MLPSIQTAHLLISTEGEKIHCFSSIFFSPNLHFDLSSDTPVSLHTQGKNLPQNDSIPGNLANLIPMACLCFIYLLSWGKKEKTEKREKKKPKTNQPNETNQRLVLFPPRKDLPFRINQLTFAIMCLFQCFCHLN